jgi:hypothetical protein
MRLILTSIFIVLIAALVSCSKEDENADPNYPTTINALTSAEIDQLFADLSGTPFYQCTSVDTFGHCYITLKNRDCGKFDSIDVIYSANELSKLFFETILDYGTFLNVTDTSGIRIASIQNLNGMDFEKFTATYPDSTTPGWIISSNRQVIKGHEIPGTEIKVLIYFDQVRSIEGKRYSDLYIPLSDAYTEIQAQESILNKEFTYIGTTLKVTESTYWNKSEKIIFPTTKSGKIELRVCWALYPESWQVIVDTQTGKALTSVNLDKL